MTFIRILFIILICGGWLPAGASDSRSLELTVLDGIEARYAGNSFSAEFTQTATLSALDISETASGRAWFSHPGKMKWQYLLPERHDIITNGSTLWIFRPDENQVMQGEAASFFQSGAGGAFLSDIPLIRKQYAVSVTQSTRDWAELLLEDQSGHPDIRSILLRASLQTFHIFEVTTVNGQGDTTRFEFTDITFEPISDEWFEFAIPPVVSVIDINLTSRLKDHTHERNHPGPGPAEKRHYPGP